MKSGIFKHVLFSLALFTFISYFTIGSYGQSKSDGDVSSQTAGSNADYLSELRKQQEKLSLENSVAEMELKKSLETLLAEKQRLDIQNPLALQRFYSNSAAILLEIEELSKKMELAAKQVDYKEILRKTKQNEKLGDLRNKIEEIQLSNDLITAENSPKTRELSNDLLAMQIHITKLQAQRLEIDNSVAVLNSQIELQDRQDQIKNRVKRDIQYTTEPFTNGILTISDRRIELNGIIGMNTASYIEERINYFNNQNQKYPIFIVIDSSPGGSVMAGYQILKSMNGSPAPVYVVVKSFAASMAANITTQAKRSFIYPNAIMIHHQILTVSSGNMTEQKESVKDMEEWWKRLAAPVAAKMGISLDEFIRQMYKHRSSGDWLEFGDQAKKLRWADEIVDTINEESYVKNPDLTPSPPMQPRTIGLEEQTDSDGHHYQALPRIAPVDCYYLYNPDNYYRLTR